jgi:hypothetical protein
MLLGVLILKVAAEIGLRAEGTLPVGGREIDEIIGEI